MAKESFSSLIIFWYSYILWCRKTTLSNSESVLLAVLILLILKNAELFFSFWCTSRNSPKCRVLIDCKGNVVEHWTKWEINSLHPAVKFGLSFQLQKLSIFLSCPLSLLVSLLSPFFLLPFPFSHPGTNQARPCLAFKIVGHGPSYPSFYPHWCLFFCIFFFFQPFIVFTCVQSVILPANSWEWEYGIELFSFYHYLILKIFFFVVLSYFSNYHY